MNRDLHLRTYRRFGAFALVHDLATSALKRVLDYQSLVVYVMDTAETVRPPDGLDVHRLTEAELETLVDGPGLELPAHFMRTARANGDDCFGAFRGGECCGYAWYATRPAFRGQAIQRWIKRVAGARAVGRFAWWRRGARVRTFATAGSRAHGFVMYRSPSPASTSDATGGRPLLHVKVLRDVTAMEREAGWARLVASQPMGAGLFYQPWWLRTIEPRYVEAKRTPFVLRFRRRRRKLAEQGVPVEVVRVDRFIPEQFAAVARLHAERQATLRAQGQARYALFEHARDHETLERRIVGAVKAILRGKG